MGYPDWFQEWAIAHRTAFLLPAEWLDAAALWWVVFASLGAGPGELAAATRAMQAGDRPKFPGDHLPAVKAAVGDLRNARLAADRAAANERPDDRGRCVDCQDMAWVVVPHGQWLDCGEWVPDGYGPDGEPRYVTASATCRCYRGRKTFDEAVNHGLKPPTLDRVERACPTWRDQMAVQAAAKVRRAATERQTAYPAGLVAAVAGGMAMPARTGRAG